MPSTCTIILPIFSVIMGCGEPVKHHRHGARHVQKPAQVQVIEKQVIVVRPVRKKIPDGCEYTILDGNLYDCHGIKIVPVCETCPD